MKSLWALAALAVAALLLAYLYFLARDPGTGPRDAAPPEAAATASTPAETALVSPSTSPREGAAPVEEKRPETAAHATPPAPAARLVYGDGAAAAGVVVHLAVGRPLETRRFFNRDYPAHTVHLVTHHLTATTGEDGSFRFRDVQGPSGARRILFTDADSAAHTVVELSGGEVEIRASRRVKVKGTLRDAEGRALAGAWLGAQLGRPEDFDSRPDRYHDSFATAAGPLEVDPFAKAEASTGGEGRFELVLATGRNVFSFGDARDQGVLEVAILEACDLGDIVVPGTAVPAPSTPYTLHGTVLNAVGAPHEGCAVRLWDDAVGPFTQETATDGDGAYAFEGVKGPRAVLWAVSTGRRHVVLPDQSSGTVQLPCETPVVMRAPQESEYTWLRPRDLKGFFLFLRDGILLDGASLDGTDTLGVPPGEYRIVALTPEGTILEASLTLRESGERELVRASFEDRTR